MIRAKRIGHATFETPDLDRQIAYYTEVVGLVLADRTADRACLASPVGELAILLEHGAQPRCTGLAFDVGPHLDSGELARRLSGLEIASETKSDALPGIRRQTTFADPKGTMIGLFSESRFLDVQPITNGGVSPFKLGHVAFFHPEPQAMADFYETTLDFRVSDWVADFFVFMRCGIDHHTVNFLRGDRIGMHHIAFEVRDSHEVAAACDVLGRQRIPITWGPVRHGPGHNIAVYHHNPDGQTVEFFCDLDRMTDEELGYFEPRPWHRDRPQKPKVWDAKDVNIWGPPPTEDFMRRR